MKLLVTGAAGFIGAAVCRRLVDDGCEVVGLDNINDYYDPNLKYARLALLGIDREEADWYRFAVGAKSGLFKFIRMISRIGRPCGCCSPTANSTS